MRLTVFPCAAIAVVAAGVLSIVLAHNTSAQDAKQHSVASAGPAPTTAPAATLERGKYLVTILACNDCHTPFKPGANGPEPDMTRMLSGHPEQDKLPPPPAAAGPWIWGGSATNTAFYGPWGISYAMNLTPDVNTGMGIWTEEMFIKAMRTGKHFGQSRPIMPPMPAQAYGQMTDEDLKAVYAFLRSIPPVKNLVPDYQPPGK